MTSRIGPYRVVSTLGEGGMGVVYAAHDDRLGRPVALKLIHPNAQEAAARERFWREARAAARVSHPGICPIFDVGEHDGRPYLVMELLEGEPLDARLARGPLPFDEAIAIALGVLDALDALHRAGLVHRDLKPSNIFLTPRGPRLLDFGVATRAGALEDTSTRLTLPGVVVGTPRYMAPEQVAGREAGRHADLFAAGALLFEMLAGRPAFGGHLTVEVLHAVVHQRPPALAGPPVVVAVDRVIQRALAKRPEDRFDTAADMARALAGCQTSGTTATVAHVAAVTRLIVLPFRLLRPDADAEFLAFSLPDAITASLSGLGSLVVRSSLVAARYGPSADIARLAAEAEVDAAVTGTILRSGDRVRVTSQLVEVPSGVVIWSRTNDVTWGDLFDLQDRLTRAIVESLAVPLSAKEATRLGHDVPASAAAYEFYLRANQVTNDSGQWDVARDLYERAVAEDPGFAPAWARLGRVLRLIGKYTDDAEGGRESLRRSDEAFDRAFRLSPELPVAHRYFTLVEVESGRAIDAIVRLARLAAERPADPELFAGLVHACRYCGLLDASIAADARVRRLDPSMTTSVAHTWLMLGEYDRAVALDDERPPYVTVLALTAAARVDDLRELSRRILAEPMPNLHLRSVALLVAGSTGLVDVEEHRHAIRTMADASTFTDPEGWFYWAVGFAGIGDHEPCLDLLERAVRGGFQCPQAFHRFPQLASVREHRKFGEALAEAERGHANALARFAEAGGPALLGDGTAPSDLAQT